MGIYPIVFATSIFVATSIHDHFFVTTSICDSLFCDHIFMTRIFSDLAICDHCLLKFPQPQFSHVTHPNVCMTYATLLLYDSHQWQK